jgi:hypothetical protein
MCDHALERERLVTANAVCSRYISWAAAVGKWTQPLVTVEKIRSVTGDLVRQQDKAKSGEKAEVSSKN